MLSDVILFLVFTFQLLQLLKLSLNHFVLVVYLFVLLQACT